MTERPEQLIGTLIVGLFGCWGLIILAYGALVLVMIVMAIVTLIMSALGVIL